MAENYMSNECMSVNVDVSDIEREKKSFVTQRPLPTLYVKKEDCCGCSSCYSICILQQLKRIKAKMGKDSFEIKAYKNYGAISMEEDEEGFFYPIIDAERCMRCYRCVEVCPIKTISRK